MQIFTSFEGSQFYFKIKNCKFLGNYSNMQQKFG